MKNRSPLALIEQVIMVLVFALAAALCLTAFSHSDRISEKSEALDMAAHTARNAAEITKAFGGDMILIAEHFGAEAENGTVTVHFDKNWNISPQEGDYILTVSPDKSDALLGSARIAVSYNGGADIFSLTAAWQKEAQNG